MSPDYEKHPDLFYQMVTSFRSELSEYSSQCVGNSSERVPWLCGDTTRYWKESYQKNMILYMDITDNGLMMKYIFSAFRIVTDMN